MRSEPLLFGATILVTLLAQSQSRVMVNRFWVEVPQRPMIITRSIKEPAYEAATEVTQPPQNLIVNPTKMSAIEAAPRKSKIGYTTLRESFQKDDEVRYQKTRSAEPSTTPHPDENDDVCEPHQVRICENCLKITRAPQAYQQCCSNVNNAFSWCERIFKYVNNQG